ncbi:MAG TPA: hypothetical protein P5561_02955 [Candidatus Omnitrophota bacterium]|nr:hypothetical protein [Candidatus Omnitrophota bacterium]HRY85473.1 hypothetical protein [Candidatus Omnitrophota bacterium]
MDQNEIIALSIVALAALLALRHFISTKGGGGCCGSDCLPGSKLKSEKKDQKETKEIKK